MNSDTRDFYVTLRRGKRTAFLAGPYATHEAALAAVEPAVDRARTEDSSTWFDSIGTSSLPRGAEQPCAFGVL